MSTLSTIHDELTEQLARTTDLRWQAVLRYVRTVEEGGGQIRLGFDGDPTARTLRAGAVTVGDEVAVLTRQTDAGRRVLQAVQAAQVSAEHGQWVLHGDAGTEDLWQVVAQYRYVAAVTHPDEPTEQVHVLLRLH